jgi:hypothetical protein
MASSAFFPAVAKNDDISLFLASTQDVKGVILAKMSLREIIPLWYTISGSFHRELNLLPALLTRFDVKSFEKLMAELKALPKYLRDKVLDEKTPLAVVRLMTISTDEFSEKFSITDMLAQLIQIGLPIKLLHNRVRITYELHELFLTGITQGWFDLKKFLSLCVEAYPARQYPDFLRVISEASLVALRDNLKSLPELVWMTKEDSKKLEKEVEKHLFLTAPERWQRAGASSLQDFKSRFDQLSKTDQSYLRQEIIFRISTAESITKNPTPSLDSIFTEEQLKALDSCPYKEPFNRKSLHKLVKDNFTMDVLVREGILTINDMLEMNRIISGNLPGNGLLNYIMFHSMGRSESFPGLCSGKMTIRELLDLYCYEPDPLPRFGGDIISFEAFFPDRYEFLSKQYNWHRVEASNQNEFEARFKALPIRFQQAMMKPCITLHAAENIVAVAQRENADDPIFHSLTPQTIDTFTTASWIRLNDAKPEQFENVLKAILIETTNRNVASAAQDLASTRDPQKSPGISS